MRKVSVLICKKYKSPVFHNTEDLNQLKFIKIMNLFAKVKNYFQTSKHFHKNQARSPAGFKKFLDINIPLKQ